MHLSGQSKAHGQLRFKGTEILPLDGQSCKMHAHQWGMDKELGQFCKQSTIRRSEDGIPENTHRFQVHCKNKRPYGRVKKNKGLGQRT